MDRWESWPIRVFVLEALGCDKRDKWLLSPRDNDCADSHYRIRVGGSRLERQHMILYTHCKYCMKRYFAYDLESVIVLGDDIDGGQHATLATTTPVIQLYLSKKSTYHGQSLNCSSG